MDELVKFKDNMRVHNKDTLVSNESDLWYIHHEPPCWDFNREIFHPGAHEKMPDGCIQIRVDDDFWIVGRLPYRFINKSLENIVRVFWPEVTDPVFNPDVIFEEES